MKEHVIVEPSDLAQWAHPPGTQAPAAPPQNLAWPEAGGASGVVVLRGARPWLRDWIISWCELTKARLTLLVLFTTSIGFGLGTAGAADWAGMSRVLMGTALVAGAAAALNQYREREWDARMRRTEHRPLPAGRLQPLTAYWFGMVSSLAGLVYLAWAVNPLTSLLGAITLGNYLLVYTPLKRITPWNTLVGAVSGAMPILMGWTAARGELSRAGWVLFAILYLWQMPHFFAIAWLYRADYARAGFAMLSVNDPSGRRTGRHSLFYAMVLVPVSLAPFFLGLTGPGYLGAAVGLGSAWIWLAGRFAGRPDERRAQGLFLYSLLYQPLLLVWMLMDRVKL